MAKSTLKRTVDMQIIAEWVEPRSRVLDLGCGRGVLLEYLAQTKAVFAVGVDLDFDKISACVRRGLSAYQGDMHGYMRACTEGAFDRIIFSRTLEELTDPGAAIAEALRVGRAVTVGFVNHGYWKNRRDALLAGRKVVNPVYTTEWHASRPSNPATIADFERFCATQSITILRRAYLRGDWKTPCVWWPNLRAGYALYDLGRAVTG